MGGDEILFESISLLEERLVYPYQGNVNVPNLDRRWKIHTCIKKETFDIFLPSSLSTHVACPEYAILSSHFF